MGSGVLAGRRQAVRASVTGRGLFVADTEVPSAQSTAAPTHRVKKCSME